MAPNILCLDPGLIGIPMVCSPFLSALGRRSPISYFLIFRELMLDCHGLRCPLGLGSVAAVVSQFLSFEQPERRPKWTCLT